MARKTKSEPIELEDGFLFKVDDVPASVKRIASQYKKASVEKSKAAASFKATEQLLIDKMNDEGCEACIVELDGVRKVIRLTKQDKLRQEVLKQPPAAGE